MSSSILERSTPLPTIGRANCSRWGYEVRLVPPSYTNQAYVRRQKNDAAADAEPIVGRGAGFHAHQTRRQSGE
jgi:transposase